MITDRYKLQQLRLKLLWVVSVAATISLSSVKCNNSLEEITTEYYAQKQPEGPEHRTLFSPRVDYNEWMPVGRSDPLKNEPTYDYSPPVVEPVRYWAENTKSESNANSIANKDKKDKNEILVLGVPSKRQNYRKESKYQSHDQLLNKYPEQEQSPKLQGTIRRSYTYGHYHNLPTRLMPPPMQTIAPSSTSSAVGKLPTTESYHHTYHHHYSAIPSAMGSYSSNNGYYQHSSQPQNPTWGFNKIPFDTRHEESVNFVSITKPELSIVPSAPTASAVFNLKTNEMQQPHFKRKPWIQELLKKEITKSPPPQMLTNYVSQQQPIKTSVPQHQNTIQPITITTGFTPLITTSVPTIITTERPSPAFVHSTTPLTTTISTTTTTTTIASPTEMTTDSLFSHYKQPERPLYGPMYLIIEGHSKVKTYGLKDNDTRTLHKPKIVPIAVPNEEAIVKKHVVLKDENGKAIEVKHLHNKKTENKKNSIENNLVENDAEPLSLLALLDNSLSGFFSEKNIFPVENSTKHIANESENAKPMIYVTTQPPVRNLTKTTILEPIKSALIQDPKETRQIFDYDQLTEPSIFDFFSGGSDYDDYDEYSKIDDTKSELQNLSLENLENSTTENNEDINPYTEME